MDDDDDLELEDAVRVGDEGDDVVVTAPRDVNAVRGDHAVAGPQPGPLGGRVLHDGAA